jgi:hypothetical protein
MNIKYLIGLCLISSVAMADDLKEERYNYSQDLDIAKVISLSTIPNNGCQVTDAIMIYQDSKGVTHKLIYSVMGGCFDN